MNLEFTRMALVSSMLAALLICSSEIKISQAASSGQKVHTPVVEKIGELTDEELLKYEQEMSKPKNESGKFTEGVLWKIEKDKSKGDVPKLLPKRVQPEKGSKYLSNKTQKS